MSMTSRRLVCKFFGASIVFKGESRLLFQGKVSSNRQLLFSLGIYIDGSNRRLNPSKKTFSGCFSTDFFRCKALIPLCCQRFFTKTILPLHYRRSACCLQ
jgi:hypothetical protein